MKTQNENTAKFFSFALITAAYSYIAYYLQIQFDYFAVSHPYIELLEPIKAVGLAYIIYLIYFISIETEDARGYVRATLVAGLICCMLYYVYDMKMEIYHNKVQIEKLTHIMNIAQKHSKIKH